ncbi:MAG: hypothetical protein WD066_13635 [Planctomycetaceae bacterium]
MIAIKAHFDGEKIVLPEELRGTPAGEVLVVFEGALQSVDEADREFWNRLQEQRLADVWENEEDAVYDRL